MSLKSDDFDQTIRVHIARLVTLSVRIVARCAQILQFFALILIS